MDLHRKAIKDMEALLTQKELQLEQCYREVAMIKKHMSYIKAQLALVRASAKPGRFPGGLLQDSG